MDGPEARPHRRRPGRPPKQETENCLLLESSQLLADELTAYRVTLSEDGKDSFGNGREAPNDDLVLGWHSRSTPQVAALVGHG